MSSIRKNFLSATYFVSVFLAIVCLATFGARAVATKNAGFDLRDLTSIDGTAFEVVSKSNGHSVRVEGAPAFNSLKTAFISLKDDFESNHPQAEARLFDCSKRDRCLEVWHSRKAEGGRDPKWTDNDNLQFTLVRVSAGQIVTIPHLCSVKKKSCQALTPAKI